MHIPQTQALKGGVSEYQKSPLYNFVGKSGFARAAHSLRYHAVSRYEELHDTGKLAENHKFFAKLRGRLLETGPPSLQTQGI
jgi:hypothetical protein